MTYSLPLSHIFRGATHRRRSTSPPPPFFVAGKHFRRAFRPKPKTFLINRYTGSTITRAATPLPFVPTPQPPPPLNTTPPTPSQSLPPPPSQHHRHHLFVATSTEHHHHRSTNHDDHHTRVRPVGFLTRTGCVGFNNSTNAGLHLVLKTAHNGAFGVVLHRQGVRSGLGQSRRKVRCVFLPAKRVAATSMGALGGSHRCRDITVRIRCNFLVEPFQFPFCLALNMRIPANRSSTSSHQPPPVTAAAAALRHRKTFPASFPAETKNISYQPIYRIHNNTRRHAPPLRPHSTAATSTQHHPTYAVTTAATATLSTSSSSSLPHHFHRTPPPKIHQPPRPPHKAERVAATTMGALGGSHRCWVRLAWFSSRAAFGYKNTRLRCYTAD
nr:hypothetical protein [Tanacetum cinerariifolium]